MFVCLCSMYGKLISNKLPFHPHEKISILNHKMKKDKNRATHSDIILYTDLLCSDQVSVKLWSTYVLQTGVLGSHTARLHLANNGVWDSVLYCGMC